MAMPASGEHIHGALKRNIVLVPQNIYAARGSAPIKAPRTGPGASEAANIGSFTAPAESDRDRGEGPAPRPEGHDRDWRSGSELREAFGRNEGASQRDHTQIKCVRRQNTRQ
jgi:hypothetical protein